MSCPEIGLHPCGQKTYWIVKKIKKGNRRYPNTLKRKIGQEYLDGQYSYAVGAETYGLKDKNVVREIVKWYKKNLELAEMDEAKADKNLPQTEPPTDELKALEAELKAARMKIAGLETLIDQAEQSLGIEIRKKSGTKQSK